MLKASKASATGKRATDEYRHWLCTPIITPSASRALRWAALVCNETLCDHSSTPTTTAVERLRTATAVATSRPCANAMRAATWLAPIMNAMSNRVRKAVRLKARVEVFMVM